MVSLHFCIISVYLRLDRCFERNPHPANAEGLSTASLKGLVLSTSRVGVANADASVAMCLLF